MHQRATVTSKQTIFFHALFLSLVSVLMWSTAVWASTRVGNAELQLWYRQRHTFHTDGGRHVNWVQWRNEVFFWFVYEDLIKNGKLLDKIEIPWVERGVLNARYRFRADPVYSIREHFNKIYDDEEKESFIFPENGFRDLFLDLDFGRVGRGYLSMRIGNQQIVWGESDLFRSIDIINPLRIDQNQAAGEKFDEFRTPIWAIKFLYNIGNVGDWFSNVSIEPFWSPRFRSGTSDLILEGAYRLPHHIRACLDENDREVPYDPVTCSKLRASNGERVFVPYRPGWLGQRRIRNPWSFFAVGPNPNTSPDYQCLTQRCSPDIFGDRASLFANLKKGSFTHVLNGAFNKGQAGGIRIQGTSVWGLDWSLVYIYLPTGESGVFDFNQFLIDPESPLGIPIYGDPQDVQAFFPGAPIRGTFEEGLRRCFSDGGKNHESKDGRGYRAGGTVLVGADVFGYNNPKRFVSTNPRGALADDGNPVPGKHQAKRPPLSFCLAAQHDYVWSHVPGFTLTYNDFEYTGAVFRVEQSFSTKEVIRAVPPTAGRRSGDPLTPRFISDNFDKYTGVWRSMVGFDLFRSLGFFRYIPGIHRSFYEQAWFLSGQWLMQNHWNNVANNFCQNVDKVGNGLTQEQIDADRAATGLRSYSTPQCRRYRWNHLFTLGLANQGLFGSRVETRNAVALEPREQQWLLFSQWWWRNVLGNPNVELSVGVAWYPGARLGNSWSSIQHFADRDQFWFEFTYYLL